MKIDNSFKFEMYVKELCKKVNQKVNAFGRIRPYLGDQMSKLLLNSVVMLHFSYFLVIWLFRSKAINNEINRTHKHALRMLCRDYDFTFEKLLPRDEANTMYIKNLQNLIVEIYESINNLNPEYMRKFCQEKCSLSPSY